MCPQINKSISSYITKSLKHQQLIYSSIHSSASKREIQTEHDKSCIKYIVIEKQVFYQKFYLVIF